MPHTLIDIQETFGHLVWGLVTNQNDLEENSLPSDEFFEIETGLTR